MASRSTRTSASHGASGPSRPCSSSIAGPTRARRPPGRPPASVTALRLSRFGRHRQLPHRPAPDARPATTTSTSRRCRSRFRSARCCRCGWRTSSRRARTSARRTSPTAATGCTRSSGTSARPRARWRRSRRARRVRPHAVRDTPALLADYQKRLVAQGVELRWPGLDRPGHRGPGALLPPALQYAMEAKGKATDAAGAAMTLRCVNPQSTGFGTVATSVPADAYRGRPVTLAAEVQTAGAKGGASLWLRIDAGEKMLLLQNGTDQPLRGDTAWTRRVVIAARPRRRHLAGVRRADPPRWRQRNGPQPAPRGRPRARGRRAHRAGGGQGPRRGHHDRQGERPAR